MDFTLEELVIIKELLKDVPIKMQYAQKGADINRKLDGQIEKAKQEAEEEHK